MQCPMCKAARTYVSTTTTHESGGVYRYRKCSGCARNFITLESVLEDTPKLGRPAFGEKSSKPKPKPKPKPKIPTYKEAEFKTPKPKATVNKQDAKLISRIRTEIRHKFEDMRAEKEE